MLVVKENSAYRTASRHYIHHLNSVIDGSQDRLMRAKARADASKDELDEWYPNDMFKNAKQPLTRVGEELDEIVSTGESPRQLALLLQKRVTEALVKIESSVTKHEGLNKVLDNEITNILMDLFVLSAATAFITKSRGAREEKLQKLLHPSSPSEFFGALAVSTTQKTILNMAIEVAAREIKDAIAEAEDRNADASDDERDDNVRDRVLDNIDVEELAHRSTGDLIHEHIQDIALNNAQEWFDDNEDKVKLMKILIPKQVQTMHDKLTKSAIKKIDGIVEEERNEEMSVA